MGLTRRCHVWVAATITGLGAMVNRYQPRGCMRASPAVPMTEDHEGLCPSHPLSTVADTPAGLTTTAKRGSWWMMSVPPYEVKRILRVRKFADKCLIVDDFVNSRDKRIMKHIIQPLLALLVSPSAWARPLPSTRVTAIPTTACATPWATWIDCFRKPQDGQAHGNHREANAVICAFHVQNPSQRSQMMVTIPVVSTSCATRQPEHQRGPGLVAASDLERRLSTFECQPGQRLASGCGHN